MTRISDMTPLVIAQPTGIYVPSEKTGSTTNYRVDLAAMSTITPQMFYEATDPDAQNMMQRAADYLQTFAYNPSPGGYYTGAPTLFCPAGLYEMHAPIDFLHSGNVIGEGDGQFGPGSGGCTHFKWTGAASGFRVQGADTSGETTVDSPIHRGAAGMYFADMCLEGGFDGTTESDHHGLVIRTAIHAERMWIKNFPGEGVKCWAGTINGGSPVGGNVSTTFLQRIKTEGNRGGIDIRGGDANVITTINCQGYQNRWFGLLDDNGAGSNTHIGMHCASNGQVTGTWAQTQCSYTGKYYALAWGGDPTVAPSGTTADTANWYYIGAGAPVTNLIPAWTATPNTFRAGGDYMTLHTAGVQILNCYSETGSFSQFSANTIMHGCTLLSQYLRGGAQFLPSGLNDGTMSRVWGNNHHYMDFSGSEAGLIARDLAAGTTLGYLQFLRGDRWWVDSGLNIHSGGLQMAETTVIDTSRNATLAATTATTVAATGAVSGASVAATGAVTGASVAATGAVTGASVAIGSGTALTKAVVYTPSITPASIAAATVAEQTFTVTGLTTADKVIVNPPAISNATGVAGARVSAADTLAIRFTNPTAGALTPTAGTYTVLAFRS